MQCQDQVVYRHVTSACQPNVPFIICSGAWHAHSSEYLIPQCAGSLGVPWGHPKYRADFRNRKLLCDVYHKKRPWLLTTMYCVWDCHDKDSLCTANTAVCILMTNYNDKKAAYWNEGGRLLPIPPILCLTASLSLVASALWLSVWLLSAVTNCNRMTQVQQKLKYSIPDKQHDTILHVFRN